MSKRSEPTPNGAAPISQQKRIYSLDVLRGFAVLGILVMNIQSYSMIGAAYSNPHAYGDLTGINYAIWYLCHLLADLKFMALFSLLFGAGIVVTAQRREDQGVSAAAFHYRRIFWLMLIGAVHGYAIWYGDILVIYAMCSAIIFWAWRLRPIWLITLAIALLTVGSAASILSGLSMPYWGEEQLAELRQDWLPGEAEIQDELARYRGSVREQAQHRVPMVVMFQTFLFGFYFMWRVGGLMLLGMALLKTSILDASRSRAFYGRCAVLGAAVGLPLIAFGVTQNNAHGWSMEYSFFFGNQFNYWGSLPLVASYIGLVCLACKTETLSWLTRRLAKT